MEVCRHANEKHLSRYVNDFTFRLNDGTVKRRKHDRLVSFVDMTISIRMTLKGIDDLKESLEALDGFFGKIFDYWPEKK